MESMASSGCSSDTDNISIGMMVQQLRSSSEGTHCCRGEAHRWKEIRGGRSREGTRHENRQVYKQTNKPGRERDKQIRPSANAGTLWSLERSPCRYLMGILGGVRTHTSQTTRTTSRHSAVHTRIQRNTESTRQFRRTPTRLCRPLHQEARTCIMYESPHRIADTLRGLLAASCPSPTPLPVEHGGGEAAEGEEGSDDGSGGASIGPAQGGEKTAVSEEELVAGRR